MMQKVWIFLVTLLLVAGTVMAQHPTRINVNKGEKWWGIFLSGGMVMPLDDPFEAIDLATWNNALTTPFLVSSTGRYIWSAKPFTIAFTGESFLIDAPDEPVQAVVAGKTLREAYLVCRHRNFPPDGMAPAPDLFKAPIYDLSPQLGFAATETSIEQYADGILGAGYPVGTLLFPYGWNRQIGSYSPAVQQFSNFTVLVQRLHAKGFKVMLPITPFVSGDGPIYREYRSAGYFLTNPEGRAVVCEWEGGLSACYDLTAAGVAEMLTAKIDSLHRVCGVDGFLFDGFGVQEAVAYAAGGADAFRERWMSLGGENPFTQYTLSALHPPHASRLYLLPPASLVDASMLQEVQLNTLTSGLLGLTYMVATPDVEATNGLASDANLLLRYLQLSVVMPVMQIGVAPWLNESREVREACREAMQVRSRIGEYMAELAVESARTAEPLIRPMEYVFPRNGFSDCNDQFMIGSRYLVAPLYDAAHSRMVRFPRGVWTDESGRRFKGPLVANVETVGGKVLIFEQAK